jgi:hypothetical protein
MSTESLSFPIFLAVQPFSYNSIWFAGIYAKDCIPKLFLVRAVMKVVRNTVEGVKFTFTTVVCSVLVAAWHYECHRPSNGIMRG